MKRIPLIASAALAAAVMTAPALAADVGVSVSVSQPGVYGRIDIGNQPPPPVALVYPQPVVITQTPVAVYQRPIYLHVPPGHQKNWGKHCARYGACGQPVYFVQDGWYQQHYARPAPPPRAMYRDDRRDDRRHGPDHGHGHGNGRGHENGNGKGHGNGHGEGKGHGKGHRD